MLYGDEVIWDAYGRLSQAVASGKPAFDQLYGQSFYEYLDHHPATAALFHEAMTGFSEQEAEAILTAYDFSAVRSIVDVGGGKGSLMAALLRVHQHLRAVVYDGSPPDEDAQRLFMRPELSARAKFEQGDFFLRVPDGADLHLLKSILHNWNDAAVIAILHNCRAAMSAQGRLLVVERVVPAGDGPAEAKLFDVNMMVTVGGQERRRSTRRS